MSRPSSHLNRKAQAWSKENGGKRAMLARNTLRLRRASSLLSHSGSKICSAASSATCRSLRDTRTGRLHKRCEIMRSIMADGARLASAEEFLQIYCLKDNARSSDLCAAHRTLQRRSSRYSEERAALVARSMVPRPQVHTAFSEPRRTRSSLGSSRNWWSTRVDEHCRDVLRQYGIASGGVNHLSGLKGRFPGARAESS